ncbi:MAG: HU family DNA-binding protein [Ruminococcus sp.]|nr:HU family DNA-binding protein [Ruminococcus sp.]
MTKTELINSIAEKAGCTKKDAAAALDATVAVINESLEKGEKVSITGFGTFEIRERGEKTCINPRTKKKMVCPPSKAPAFKAGRTLKEAVNK